MQLHLVLRLSYLYVLFICYVYLCFVGLCFLYKLLSIWWLWTLAAVLFVSVIAGILFYRNSKRAKEIIRIFKPAHEIAFDQLRLLLKADLVSAGW